RDELHVVLRAAVLRDERLLVARVAERQGDDAAGAPLGVALALALGLEARVSDEEVGVLAVGADAHEDDHGDLRILQDGVGRDLLHGLQVVWRAKAEVGRVAEPLDGRVGGAAAAARAAARRSLGRAAGRALARAAAAAGPGACDRAGRLAAARRRTRGRGRRRASGRTLGALEVGHRLERVLLLEGV